LILKKQGGGLNGLEKKVKYLKETISKPVAGINEKLLEVKGKK
jgi:hypothetical protein